jgi:hypothetical protein
MRRMVRIFVCASALLAVPFCALAAPNELAAQDAAGCATKKADTERLECYDLIFKKSIHTSNDSKWQITEETSKIDDSKNVFLVLDSEDTFQNQYRQLSERI